MSAETEPLGIRLRAIADAFFPDTGASRAWRSLVDLSMEVDAAAVPSAPPPPEGDAGRLVAMARGWLREADAQDVADAASDARGQALVDCGLDLLRAAAGGCDSPAPTAGTETPTAAEVLAHIEAGGTVERWTLPDLDYTPVRHPAWYWQHTLRDYASQLPGFRLAPSPSPEGPAADPVADLEGGR